MIHLCENDVTPLEFWKQRATTITVTCLVVGSETAAKMSRSLVLQVVPVVANLITKISAVRLYLSKDLRSRDNRMAVLKSLQEVSKRFSGDIPLLNPIEDMGIRDKGLKETIKVKFTCCLER